ncbi:MAG: hypothetical protein GY796_09220 [Chloroflexi bacterium]|nr:hypothetical protein [Chloroflexota bacterium]
MAWIVAHRKWGEAMGDNILVSGVDCGPSQMGRGDGGRVLVNGVDYGLSPRPYGCRLVTAVIFLKLKRGASNEQIRTKS